jgi:hypothetical protein
MKVHTLIALGAISLGVSLASTPSALAGDCCPRGCAKVAPGAGQGRGGSGAGPLYDPDTVTTLKGTVDAVTVLPARGGRAGGMHIALKTDGQAMEVHLGPTWFLQGEGFEIAKGDAVEVIGSVVDSEGATFLIAREVKKGQKAVRLRDEQGIPAWSGGRRP